MVTGLKCPRSSGVIVSDLKGRSSGLALLLLPFRLLCSRVPTDQSHSTEFNHAAMLQPES